VLQVLVRVLVGRRDDQLGLARLLRRGGVGRAMDGDRIETALSQMIDGVVVGDLQDPVAELVAGLVRADRVERADERFLSEVFRLGPVAHHAVDQREDGTLVAGEDLAERGLPAAGRQRRELPVFERGVVGCGQRSLVLPWLSQPPGRAARERSHVGAHCGGPTRLGLAGFRSAVEAPFSFA